MMKTNNSALTQVQKSRRFPLINLSFEATIRLADKEIELKGKQISNHELRLEANPTQVLQLVPRHALHRPDISVTYPSVIKVANQTLNPEIQVVRCRRASQTKFEVTLKLLSLTDAENLSLEELLKENLATAEVANPFS